MKKSINWVITRRRKESSSQKKLTQGDALARSAHAKNWRAKRNEKFRPNKSPLPVRADGKGTASAAVGLDADDHRLAVNNRYRQSYAYDICIKRGAYANIW